MQWPYLPFRFLVQCHLKPYQYAKYRYPQLVKLPLDKICREILIQILNDSGESLKRNVRELPLRIRVIVILWYVRYFIQTNDPNDALRLFLDSIR